MFLEDYEKYVQELNCEQCHWPISFFISKIEEKK